MYIFKKTISLNKAMKSRAEDDRMLSRKLNIEGFTLIEMVVVMGMIGIITLSTLKLVRFSDVYKNLTLTTTEVKGEIRLAQTLALAPPIKDDFSPDDTHICGFGVRNGVDTSLTNSLGGLEVFYVIPNGNNIKTCRFIDDIDEVCGSVSPSGGTTCITEEVKELKNFKITEEGSNNPIKIFFKSPYGEVVGATKIDIQQVDDDGGDVSGHTRSIEITSQGKINIE